jgi:hypothetical protein
VAEELAGPSFYSYNLTTETKINIDEMIYINTAMDLPLQTGMGPDGVPILPRVPVDNTIFYWLEEDVPVPRGTLNEALDASETGVTVATGHAVRFHVGDGIRIDDEVMIVTAIDTATEELTVTRGSASLTNTTAATHNTGAEIIGLGTILIEGAIGVANFQGRDRFSNYCQILSTKVTASRTAQRIPKYGVPNELLKQMANAMHAGISMPIEHDALYGVPHLVTATNRRQTGGLKHFATTNVNSTDDWLTVEAVQTQQATIYAAGGQTDGMVLMAHPGAFEALDNLTDTGRLTTQTFDDRRRGRVSAQYVTTRYGTVMLVPNRWVKATDAFLYHRDNLIMRVFQPTVTQRLAKTDDTDSFMIVWEGGFEVKGADHIGVWAALDVTAPLPGSGLV